MRLHRFYVKQPLGEELVIDERKLVHQWLSVFRLHKDDSVLLFSSLNPSYDYQYLVTDVSRERISLSFLAKKPNIIDVRKKILYMSLVKKDTFETIVRHATELLITDIVPVLSARSEKKSLNFERLNTIAIEAAEQCGRGDIPTIHPIISFKEASLLVSQSHALCHSDGEHLISHKENIDSVWIGPEGGWEKVEIEELQKRGAITLNLGKTVFKADTAAIVGITKMFL